MAAGGGVLLPDVREMLPDSLVLLRAVRGGVPVPGDGVLLGLDLGA